MKVRGIIAMILAFWGSMVFADESCGHEDHLRVVNNTNNQVIRVSEGTMIRTKQALAPHAEIDVCLHWGINRLSVEYFDIAENKFIIGASCPNVDAFSGNLSINVNGQGFHGRPVCRMTYIPKETGPAVSNDDENTAIAMMMLGLI